MAVYCENEQHIDFYCYSWQQTYQTKGLKWLNYNLMNLKSFSYVLNCMVTFLSLYYCTNC